MIAAPTAEAYSYRLSILASHELNEVIRVPHTYSRGKANKYAKKDPAALCCW